VRPAPTPPRGARGAALARLIRALSVLLPTPRETTLLRACLQSGAPARHAWASCQRRAGDLRPLLTEDRRGLKKLLPLLLDSVQRNGLEVDEALLTVCRTAYFRATLRGRTVRRIVHDVLEALTADRLPHIVLDGPVLAETAYAKLALRHCAAVELLLRPDDLTRAARRLSTLTSGHPGRGEVVLPSLQVLRHESGLPIELRSRLVLKRDHGLSFDGLWAACRPATIAGLSTRILAPADCLLDICLRGFFDGRRAPVGWAADAWQVLHRNPDLAWEALLERSREGELALPLLVTLGYLAEHLDAPVPAVVLARLRADAAGADRVWGEKALSVAIAAPGSVARLLAAGGGWGPSLTVLKWMLLPSRGYLRANYELSRAWQVPVYYLYRPLRFAARRVAALRRS
jgi:Uncharacterised nucleotidyltransferase